MFATPRAHQGQTVEISYAASPYGTVVRRTLDHSDGTAVYHAARMQADDKGDYWDDPPPNARWRRITVREADDLLEHDR